MSLCMQTEHGGHTNAYTASEDTNYHFECNWEALEGALDRFAQFFIAPLIAEDGVEREVNAVDSECVLDQSSGQLSEHDVCRDILACRAAYLCLQDLPVSTTCSHIACHFPWAMNTLCCRAL